MTQASAAYKEALTKLSAARKEMQDILSGDITSETAAQYSAALLRYRNANELVDTMTTINSTCEHCRNEVEDRKEEILCEGCGDEICAKCSRKECPEVLRQS